MNGLIRASLNNQYAVTVFVLTIVVVGLLASISIPVDILPAFKSPAVQVLTFYGGMPAAGVEKDITNRMERWTGQAAGTARQESRSIVGASIVRNYYRDDIDPNGALTQVNSLASAAIPNLPPGTLPPVVLPFDPTSTDAGLPGRPGQRDATGVDPLRRRPLRGPQHDHGRARGRRPGGLRRQDPRRARRTSTATSMQARNLSPLDVMKAVDGYNIFLPTGDAKFGNYRLRARLQLDVRPGRAHGRHPGQDEGRQDRLPARRGRRPRTPASSRPTSCASTAGGRSTSRSSASWAPARLSVVDGLNESVPEMKAQADATATST